MLTFLQEIRWLLAQPFDLASALLVRLLSPFFAPIRRSAQYPWVIGGHRGRMRADNCGELHQYLCTQTKQPALWVANSTVATKLRNQGFACIDRNTWKSRLAILRAPVVVYSHGEDDIDQFALLWRKKIGLRVHLNHSMNHIKAGQFLRADVKNYGWLHLKIFTWTMEDFDLLLASSDLEKKHFDLSMPHQKERIKVGGGAHLDGVIRRSKTPHDRRILWFPTFRDTRAEAQELNATIAQIAQSVELQQWLEREDRHLYICHHINSVGSAFACTQDSAHTRIHMCSPASLDEHLAKSELFISDYSGILIDWLLQDRPVLFFPFDISTYLEHRMLYIPYEDLHYGPLVSTADQFITQLIQGTWQDLTPWKNRREKWKELMFPLRDEGYAARTHKSIQEHLHV